MPPLEEHFSQALLDAGLAPPATLGRTAERFAVYRNNVTVGLVEALRCRFPVTERLVGAEFFAAMARAFLRRHLPATPVLHEYGDALPEFIQDFAPARDLPYLPDVARLEAAWTQAYHAAEAPALTTAALAALPVEQLLAARLAPHPATRLLRSPYPIVAIWAAHQADEVTLAAEAWRPEQALLLRPDAEVALLPLSPGEATLTAALAGGARLAEAGALALADDGGFALGPSLLRLVEAGAFTTLSPSENAP